MLRELRIYFRLRPYIRAFREITKMRFSINIVIQSLAIAAQALNAIGDFVSPKSKPLVAGIVGIVQALTAFLAHYNNPDGSPAAEAYIKK